MDASFQAGSNDTIGGHVRHRRPDISPPFHGGGHIGPHLRHHMRLFTLTPTGGGKGGDGNLPSSHGGGPLQPQLRHQNRLFSANVALFSMLNRPDCRQKEGGKGAAGERVNVADSLASNPFAGINSTYDAKYLIVIFYDIPANVIIRLLITIAMRRDVPRYCT